MEAQTSIKVKKYLRLAKKIAQEEHFNRTGKGEYFPIDPSVIVGIAAMLQLEAMSAPMIVINNEGVAQNLHIDPAGDREGGESN